MSNAIAERFRKMADRIEKNIDEPFGGVALIIPPGDGAAGSVELLKLDPAPDAALFWGEIRSKSDEAVGELQRQMRTNPAFRH